MDSGRIIYYLDLWRNYMKSNTHKLGYKTKSSGFNTGGISSFEDLEDDLDFSAAKTIDQVIDDLPLPQKTSIYIIYLGQKSMIDIKVLEHHYDIALNMLEKKLASKNLY